MWLPLYSLNWQKANYNLVSLWKYWKSLQFCQGSSKLTYYRFSFIKSKFSGYWVCRLLIEKWLESAAPCFCCSTQSLYRNLYLWKCLKFTLRKSSCGWNVCCINQFQRLCISTFSGREREINVCGGLLLHVANQIPYFQFSQSVPYPCYYRPPLTVWFNMLFGQVP